MEGVSAERKIELIRTLRNIQKENQNSMQLREEILYGNGYQEKTERKNELDSNSKRNKFHYLKGLRLRFALSFAVFLSFLIFDYWNKDSVDTDWIVVSITKEVEGNGIDFIVNIPYTLHSLLAMEDNELNEQESDEIKRD